MTTLQLFLVFVAQGACLAIGAQAASYFWRKKYTELAHLHVSSKLAASTYLREVEILSEEIKKNNDGKRKEKEDEQG